MAESSALPTLSPLDDVQLFWSQKWSAPKLGWHLNKVNPSLEKYNNLWLGDDNENASIFVPLCGKSVDLAYLASSSKVSHVVGIDIVRDAAKQFAIEHPELSMREFSAGEIKNNLCEEGVCNAASNFGSAEQGIFIGEGITFLIGDLFDFMSTSNDKSSINKVSLNSIRTNSQYDRIYDRASLIAIEPSRRRDYVTLIGSMLNPGGSILLITIEKRKAIKDDAKLSGPPFSVDEAQVRDLYEGQEWVDSISLLEERDEIVTNADKERWETRGVSEAYELVFLIRKKSNG